MKTFRWRYTHLIQLITLLGFICCIFSPPLNASVIEQKLKYEEALEQKAVRVLQQHLNPDEYLLYVSTTYNDNKIRQDLQPDQATAAEKANNAGGGTRVKLPLLPFDLDKEELSRFFEEKKEEVAAGPSAPKELLDLSSYIRRITVNLIFDENVNEETISLISDAIKSILGFRQNRGDQFVVEKQKLIGLTPGKISQKNMSSKKLTLLDAQLKEIDVRLGEVKDNKSGLAGAIRGIEIPIASILLSLTFLGIGMLLFVAMTRNAGKMVTAVNSIGSAYIQGKEREAEARESSSGDSGGMGAMEEADQASTQIGAANIEGGGAGTGNDEEAIKERNIILDKIKNSAEEQPFIVAKYLKDFFNDKKNIVKAAAVLDSVGPEIYKDLMKFFSPVDAKKLGSFLQKEGAMEDLKAIRHEACSDLYGKLVAEELLTPEFLAGLDPSFLSEYNDNDLAASLKERSPEEIVQVFSVITPDRAAKIYQLMDEKQGAIGTVLKDVGKLDESILKGVLEFLRGNLEKLESDETHSFDPSIYLANMLRQLSTEEENTIMNTLSSEKQLLSAVKENYIAYTDLAKLDRELVRMIISPLPPKQIANLLVDTNAELTEIIKSILPEKVRLIALDELEVLNRNLIQKKRARLEAKKLQTTIIKNINNLIAQGLVDIEEIIGSEGGSDSSSDSPGAQSNAA